LIFKNLAYVMSGIKNYVFFVAISPKIYNKRRGSKFGVDIFALNCFEMREILIKLVELD
jgi:hypothetical protein